MERLPYIGMTDVPNADWLRRMLDRFNERPHGPLLLHAGVMMSFKTLNGLETKWAAAWPKKEEIAGIFVRDPWALNTLHYADYDGIDVWDNLERAVEYGGPNLDALQLDMIWPDPEVICGFASYWTNANLRIILQVGAKALAQVDDDADAMIGRLEKYGAMISDVLLDLSGGQGKAMDPARLEPYIYEIRARLPHLGITLAGGLGPDTLHLVKPLVRKFPGLSIDAQGQLRPSGSSLDPIDEARAEAYLRKAVELFCSPG